MNLAKIVLSAALMFSQTTLALSDRTDSLVGSYHCDLLGTTGDNRLESLELRASGYVFLQWTGAGQSGKEVGTYVLDEEYLIINRRDDFQLFGIQGDSLIAESRGLRGECSRTAVNEQQTIEPNSVTKTDDESIVVAQDDLPDALVGLWQSENIGLQIKFAENGMAESTYREEPSIEGSWRKLSAEQISLTFPANSEAAGDTKIYALTFRSQDQLELQSESNATLQFERVKLNGVSK